MAKENLFMKNAKDLKLVDDREIAVVADIVCTNGNSGRGYVFINGDQMHIYELHGMVNMGDHVETLDLKNAQVVKASSFVLSTSLKLTYNGHTYSFKGFTQAKTFIDAVKQSCS